MKKYLITLIYIVSLWFTMSLAHASSEDGITFHPIEHATMVIKVNDTNIYVDPVGKIEAYQKFGKPDILLITDIHHDHLDANVVKAIKSDKTTVIGPKAVIDKLGYGDVLNNGQIKTVKGITIEAIPMYNLTKERLKFHSKGRGNGYVITANGKRIYLSGDTEDIKEMRALKGIDYAFVCMNLPYTMTVEQAATAVLEFKPKTVLPYHYRGKDGMSDIKKFELLVSKDKDIKVEVLKWY